MIRLLAPTDRLSRQRRPKPPIICSAQRCRLNASGESFVRIGAPKTGFTGFSKPSCTRTEREIATITARTILRSGGTWPQADATGSLLRVAAQQIQPRGLRDEFLAELLSPI